MKRYRRRRSARVNPGNIEAESGDLVIMQDGKLYRCETPSGWDARTSGLLYPRLIPSPPGMKPIAKDNEIYWVNITEG